jgi:hypothetical protein
MSTYDDRDTAITRDPVQAPGPQYQPMPPQEYYGYGREPYRPRFGGGLGGRGRGWSETKPFYMTSEFLGTLLTIIAVAITAGVAADLDSHRALPLIAGLVAAYTLSRGIAKSGTRSRANDPRDDMQLGKRHDGN